jgi:NADP-dependent 3-hydroxy acid dehydrogenase YdfG
VTPYRVLDVHTTATLIPARGTDSAVARLATKFVVTAATQRPCPELYSQAGVTAEDIAEVIAFALIRPRHLAINEILLRPAVQA